MNIRKIYKIQNNKILLFINKSPDLKFISLTQEHGNTIHFAENVKGNEKGDGLITKSGKIIGVKTADCIPLVILTYNPLFYGVFHVGWRSFKKGIVRKCIYIFNSYGFKSQNLIAFLGPSICRRCYEVGKEFKKIFKTFIFEKNSKIYFDLKGAVKEEILRYGIKKIYDFLPCTFESDFLPSYRRTGEKSRILTLVLS